MLGCIRTPLAPPSLWSSFSCSPWRAHSALRRQTWPTQRCFRGVAPALFKFKFFHKFCNDTLRRALRRQTGWMQCVFGGVAPAPLKDKRFWNFLRDGATFFVMISLLVNCRNKPSTCGPFFITSRSALRRQTWPTQRFFRGVAPALFKFKFFNNSCNDTS